MVKRTGFGEPLRRLRAQRGLTQQEVADELVKLAWTQHRTRVGVDRQMVSKWEREEKLPDREYRELLCALYGVDQEQLGFRATISRRAVVLSASGAVGSAGLLDLLESPFDVVERIQALTSTNVSDEALDQLDNLISVVVDEYETRGPVELAPRVVRQRRLVDELLNGRQLPRQRHRLYLIAAQLSGMLGYMAVNLGRFAIAQQYCAEAFQLGDIIGNKDMQAWARGTESFCAYYVGDYRRAAELAQDGQRYAANGPQTVRLGINGEARALAKLGDTRGVDAAVSRAYKVANQLEVPPGVSSCISFGTYSHARTASNAATAYVALRQPDRVREYADQAMPTFEVSESRWSQSLIRLDLAQALVTADQPNLEEAANLTKEALTISAERPITSVLTRAREVVTASAQWHDSSEMRQVVQVLYAAELR